MNPYEITIQEYFNERVTRLYGAQAKYVYWITISELCPECFIHLCPGLRKGTNNYYRVEYIDVFEEYIVDERFKGVDKISSIIDYLAST